MKISQITRRDIVDAIMVENINWSGRLNEPEFLSRIFDLSTLPSNDVRFKDAAGDIWQHRINNPHDWEDNWIFFDERFDLMESDDEIFLRFLCETIHPIVRPDVMEAEWLCQLYNSYLGQDGFQLIEKTRISGKPVYVGNYVGLTAPGIVAARGVLSIDGTTYVAQQITRMEAAVINDPDLAIGTAKEIVETCCKTILHERGIEIPKNADLPQLVKLASRELQLTPDDIPEKAKASGTIKRLLSNLATITQGIVELRNQYGTGHGKHAKTKGLTPRHAKLAVGAASTLAVFLVETHQARNRK
jgi:hypothetical protein